MAGWESYATWSMRSRTQRSWRAPGRVNIIGEHIDYLGGIVLPFCCDLELVASARARPGPVEFTSEDGSPDAHVAGVVRALEEEGIAIRPCEGTITSTIPTGAGLSSSTALEVAVALAVTDGAKLRPEVLQRAEQIATGVPCGVMDQTVILGGRAGHAMLIDCATGATDHIAIGDGIGFVVIDTGTRRALTDGRYAQRRAEAEAGDHRRVRHAESEQARVYDAVDALRASDVASLGALVSDSHASLRDDFEVSSPALDEAADAAVALPGCTGARLVGAGFAGCVLAVVERGAEQRVAGRFPTAYVVRATEGAGQA